MRGCRRVEVRLGRCRCLPYHHKKVLAGREVIVALTMTMRNSMSNSMSNGMRNSVGGSIMLTDLRQSLPLSESFRRVYPASPGNLPSARLLLLPPGEHKDRKGGRQQGMWRNRPRIFLVRNMYAVHHRQVIFPIRYTATSFSLFHFSTKTKKALICK